MQFHHVSDKKNAPSCSLGLKEQPTERLVWENKELDSNPMFFKSTTCYKQKFVYKCLLGKQEKKTFLIFKKIILCPAERNFVLGENPVEKCKKVLIFQNKIHKNGPGKRKMLKIQTWTPDIVFHRTVARKFRC